MEQAIVTGKTPPPMPPHLLAELERVAEKDARAGSRKAVFPLDEGDVTLIYPESITASGLEDLGDYLEIFLKKEAGKRRVAVKQS